MNDLSINDFFHHLSDENRFRLLFNITNDAIFVHPVAADGTPGRFVEANDVACRRLGYSRTELKAMTPMEIGVEGEAQRAAEIGRTLLRQGHVQFETCHVTKTGRHIPVESNVIRFDYQGLTLALSVARDLSERKIAEAKYRELYESSKRSEELYRSLLHSSADAIVIYDMAGCPQYLSPAFTELFGWRLDEVRGRPIDFVPESEKKRCREMIRTVADAGVPYRGYETRRLTRDGRIVEVSISASRYNDHNGTPAGILVIHHDIGNLKRLQRELRQAQKMEAIGTLAGGIAHDFNNILMGIIGYVELAIDDLPQQTPLSDNLTEALRASYRARDLVQRILTFSHRTEPEMRPLRLGAVVKETLALLRSSLPSTISIQTDIVPAADSVLADPMQMHQIVLNLCTNAAHAMRGQENGVLAIALKPVRLAANDIDPDSSLEPGDYLKLTVRDTGHGISEDLAEMIFDPYFTTKKQGEGTGMGLTLVHGIVTAHGGEIQVTSQPNIGTAFTIYLPTIEPVAPRVLDPVTGLPKGSERILFVDDEPTILKLGKMMLERLGYRVESANNGAEALAWLASDSEGVELVITDLTMPGMTGDRLIKQIREHHPMLPIILSTGFSDHLTPADALEIGASAFLYKPLVREELANAVRTVLDKCANDTRFAPPIFG